jgi:hypothetical protein
MLVFLSLLCAGVLVAQTIRAWDHLRHFRGPFFATISNIWHLRAVMNGRMNFDTLEANRKYGTIVRRSVIELVAHV